VCRSVHGRHRVYKVCFLKTTFGCEGLIKCSAAPTAFTNIGWKYYLVFTILTAINVVIIWFFFPEVCLTSICQRKKLTLMQTKGLALEDVAEIFGDGIVLTDTREEQLHQRFKQSHYHAEVLDEVPLDESVHIDDKN
jgi:hypothetical protein